MICTYVRASLQSACLGAQRAYACSVDQLSGVITSTKCTIVSMQTNDVDSLSGYIASYEVKYTTRKPIQLPTTPIAEYELVNISGKNSYRFPKTNRCSSEQYSISGIDTAMYNRENLSSRNTRDRDETGASRSKMRRNRMSQNIVYATLTGNSAAVNRSGKRETWPATASGRKAPRYRRSLRANRLKGMMTSKIAFSCTCQPKRKDA